MFGIGLKHGTKDMGMGEMAFLQGVLSRGLLAPQAIGHKLKGTRIHFRGKKISNKTYGSSDT